MKEHSELQNFENIMALEKVKRNLIDFRVTVLKICFVKSNKGYQMDIKIILCSSTLLRSRRYIFSIRGKLGVSVKLLYFEIKRNLRQKQMAYFSSNQLM